MFNDFISQYGTTILYSILLALAGTLGKWIGGIYKKYVNNKTKREIAQICVKAVEQLYKNLHGEEKYNKAVEAITEMLAVNGITITEIELKMLIEATCQEFAKTVKENITPEPEAVDNA
jgi:hypothetical protein